MITTYIVTTELVRHDDYIIIFAAKSVRRTPAHERQFYARKVKKEIMKAV